MKVLNEPEPGVFGTTQLAEALVIPEYRDSIRAVYVHTFRVLRLACYLDA